MANLSTCCKGKSTSAKSPERRQNISDKPIVKDRSRQTTTMSTFTEQQIASNSGIKQGDYNNYKDNQAKSKHLQRYLKDQQSASGYRQ